MPACHRCLLASFGTNDNLLPPLVGLEGGSPPPDAVAAPSSNRSGLLDGDLLSRLAPPDFLVGDDGGGTGDLLCLRDILNFNNTSHNIFILITFLLCSISSVLFSTF